jgi:ABC-type sugar transport system ATPase subunit
MSIRTEVERLSVAEAAPRDRAPLVRDARILIFDERPRRCRPRDRTRLADHQALAAEGRSIIYVTTASRGLPHRRPRHVFRNGRSLAKPTSELDVDAVITLMLGRDLETCSARGTRPARSSRSRASSPTASASR